MFLGPHPFCRTRNGKGMLFMSQLNALFVVSKRYVIHVTPSQ